MMLLAGGGVTLTPRAALAQPAPANPPAALADSLTGDAKNEYTSAKLLYNDGDFANALLKFTVAYDKSKDPRLLWNMAACEKNLRHYARALRHVRAYASDTSGLVTDQERAEANELVKVMEPFTAKLRVVVNEPGAEILVDGEVMGTSPAESTAGGPGSSAITVDIGMRKIVVRKAGFQDASKEVPVGGSPEITVELPLTKVSHQGRVAVKAGASDTIAIDGKVLGTGAWSGPLDSGGHTLRVSANGMRPYQSEILVVDDQTREIAVTLEAEQGRLPLWVWITGGVVITGGLAVGGYFLLKPNPSYDGPPGNLAPGVVYTSRGPFVHAF